MNDTGLHQITEAGPVHDEREIEAVLDVLRNGSLDLGPRVAEFERRGAEMLAKEYGVMVNSGTSALWLAVDLLGCEPGDEVITSPLTFSSDVAPLVRSGIVPVFPARRPSLPRTCAGAVLTGIVSGRSPTPTGSWWLKTAATS